MRCCSRNGHLPAKRLLHFKENYIVSTQCGRACSFQASWPTTNNDHLFTHCRFLGHLKLGLVFLPSSDIHDACHFAGAHKQPHTTLTRTNAWANFCFSAVTRFCYKVRVGNECTHHRHHVGNATAHHVVGMVEGHNATRHHGGNRKFTCDCLALGQLIAKWVIHRRQELVEAVVTAKRNVNKVN